MIAALPIDCSTHRVAHQPKLHRGGLDLFVECAGRIEGVLGGAIRNQFQPQKQPTPADITNVGMLAKSGFQPCLQKLAQLPRARDQTPAVSCVTTACAAAVAIGWPR